MKTIIAASVIALGLFAGSAHASNVWTTLADAAPRSVFDQLQDTAPRSVFDQIGDAAPRSTEGRDDGVGEMHPGFEKLADAAP